MPDLEAAGEAATGGLLARAVEPGAGEADGHTHERACLNCGAQLVGDYCHACGQKAHVHRTIAAWWHDLAHGVLHLDGKTWRTLPMLAWRPGELTRRYIEGERASFVSPLAIFLFSVFLMFAVFSATGNTLIGDPSNLKADFRAEVASAEQGLAALERRRAAERAAGRPTGDIDDEIADARDDIDALRKLEQGDAPELTSELGNVGMLEQAYAKAKRNPSLLFYKLQTNAYKFSWALIPLSVPFLWLLFLHRRRYREAFSGYDHFVFTTYSIAAMSLGLILYVLLHSAGLAWGPVQLLFAVAAPVHIYRQLRGAYGISRWSAVWRTAMLLWFAGIVLTLFGLMLLALGLFG